MSSGRALLPLAALVVAACGGGSKEAPRDWCVTTTRLMHVLDQHSTTAEQETLDEWRELAPDEIRGQTEQAVAVLRRYPVDAHNRKLIAARKEIEAYADDHCPAETMTYPPRQAASG